ncbi:hypothetical protein B0H14DRAFT_2645711 [Mycena olivaceomarginata]|nr:hypothetical protein B0H14DRAFT_2645711 [Mycena olivaceomarginata]
MFQGLVKYEEQPRSKLLPKRGTLFPSRSEAVVFNCVKRALVNLALFLLPLASGLTAFALLGSRLSHSGHQSQHDLAFFLAYLASDVQGPAWPRSRGLGPACAGLGLKFLKPKPKPATGA